MRRLRVVTEADQPAPTLDAMRTPLTCIAGYAELLNASAADLGAPEARWARAIAESAEELVAALERYAEATASDGS